MEHSDDQEVLRARGTATLTGAWETTVRVGHFDLTADEPVHAGGGDRGPNPYQLQLGALAACTAITLGMYAERKGWPTGVISVDLRMTSCGGRDRIHREIHVAEDLDEQQRARLLDIASRTPVTLTLAHGVDITSEMSLNG